MFSFYLCTFVHGAARRCVTNDVTSLAGSRDLVTEPVDHSLSTWRRVAGQRNQGCSRRYCELYARMHQCLAPVTTQYTSAAFNLKFV